MSPSLFQQLPTGSRVLFIRLRNLGEAVLDTANLRALAEFRPDLEIYTLVEAIYTDLYQADPSIKAIPLTRGAASKRSSLTSRLAVIREIRRHKFTAVVNLHGGPTSAQLCFASGAKYKVGASHFRNGYAYNLRVPPAPEILGRGQGGRPVQPRPILRDNRRPISADVTESPERFWPTRPRLARLPGNRSLNPLQRC
mgnify:CR=1 FL=1